MKPALLLDAGGVFLLPDDGAVAAELAKIDIEIDVSRCKRAHYAGIYAVDLDEGPPPHWHRYQEAYVRELGISGDEVAPSCKAVNKAFVEMEWNVPIEESIAELPSLAEAAQLAIVSNSDGTVERILRSHGIGDEMVVIIDSHKVGIEKPDPKIFHMALEEIGVDPGDALHIGDSIRFDVIGARNAGVRGLHLDPFGMCESDDHEHLSSLAEVKVLL